VPPGELDGDLEFLMRVAEKVKQIREDLGKVGPVIAAQVEEVMLGRRRTLDTAHAERAAEALGSYDLLIVPTLSCLVPPVDCVEIEVRAALTLYTFPFNALGWPALAIGDVQLVGRAGADALVLGAGLKLEEALR